MTVSSTVYPFDKKITVACRAGLHHCPSPHVPSPALRRARRPCRAPRVPRASLCECGFRNVVLFRGMRLSSPTTMVLAWLSHPAHSPLSPLSSSSPPPPPRLLAPPSAALRRLLSVHLRMCISSLLFAAVFLAPRRVLAAAAVPGAAPPSLLQVSYEIRRAICADSESRQTSGRNPKPSLMSPRAAPDSAFSALVLCCCCGRGVACCAVLPAARSLCRLRSPLIRCIIGASFIGASFIGASLVDKSPPHRNAPSEARRHDCTRPLLSGFIGTRPIYWLSRHDPSTGCLSSLALRTLQWLPLLWNTG